MRPPFPSAAQAFAESIDSHTSSRHHPNARLTILPLPSLAALYPLDAHSTSTSSSASMHSSQNYSSSSSDSAHQNHHRGSQQHHQQPSYQSYDSRYQKLPSSSTSSSTSATTSLPVEAPAASPKASSPHHEYLGTNMESLLDAIEVHPTLFASRASSSRSPSPAAASVSSPSSVSSDHSATHTAVTTTYDSHDTRAISPSKRRMSISLLCEDSSQARESFTFEPLVEDNNYHPHPKAMVLDHRSVSPQLHRTPSMMMEDPHKRKWSHLSSANFEEERNAKIRRSIQDHVPSFRHSNAMDTYRYQMTTISCLHASVAQKSYGSEKRFLCPPPIVQIQASQDDSNSALSNKPQVAMSVICEAGENSTLGQRSTLEEDHSSTFRYLYVSGTAKAKSFQLKLKVYGRSCLPNGFISNDSTMSQDSEAKHSITEDQPEPYAVFDSAPITIISKPSKKTAKARSVSSCILAGSLVSLFNRINSQTVRTKYMSVQDGEFCAKNASWSAFSITIVANGPLAPVRVGSIKSHRRQQQPVVESTSSPITYGAEIILTESATGLQSDRLIVCKVENGRIMDDAVGPICQMQKVALRSIEGSKEGQPIYLGAMGEDHQGGRFMDHSTMTTTGLKYHPSTMVDGAKAGNDDFLCWTIVGISKFEYTYFESLPTSPASRAESKTAPFAITPFPTLTKNPEYNAASHTLELSVSNFYSPMSVDSSNPTPMQVWLGSTGPLTTQVIRQNNSAADQTTTTTLLVNLPQDLSLANSEEVTLPLLFVRPEDGVAYDSRAKVLLSRSQEIDRWTVQIV